MPERFVIEKVTLLNESEGPDYFSSGAFQVTDTTTGRVVARFPWSLEEAYMANKSYAGPFDVRISDDGTEAIATTEREEERVLLPSAWREIVFDGVRITADMDVAEFARRIAIDDGPADPASGHRQPGGQWLWKLHTRLGETPLAFALRTAIAALLSDPDSRARASAVRFYYFVPGAPGSERVCELAETSRELLPNREFNEMLAMRLAHVGADARWLAVARKEALAPGASEPVFQALAEHDPDWLLENMLAVARAAPDRWQDLLAVSIFIREYDAGKMAAWLVAAGVVTKDRVLRHVRERHPAWRPNIEKALRG